MFYRNLTLDPQIDGGGVQTGQVPVSIPLPLPLPLPRLPLPPSRLFLHLLPSLPTSTLAKGVHDDQTAETGQRQGPRWYAMTSCDVIMDHVMSGDHLHSSMRLYASMSSLHDYHAYIHVYMRQNLTFKLTHIYMYMCLVCLFDLACFFLSSFSSLI